MNTALIAALALAVQGAFILALLRMPRREPQPLAVRAKATHRTR